MKRVDDSRTKLGAAEAESTSVALPRPRPLGASNRHVALQPEKRRYGDGVYYCIFLVSRNMHLFVPAHVWGVHVHSLQGLKNFSVLRTRAVAHVTEYYHK